MNARLPHTLAPAFAGLFPTATPTLDKMRAVLADIQPLISAEEREAVASIAAVQPVALDQLNDDDIYIYDASTHELLRQVGSKSPAPTLLEGQRAIKGMRARLTNLPLWSRS